MSSKPTKIDRAWEILFNKYEILKNVDADGTFRITSEQINKVHQARLMAKFDQSAQLPIIFRNNQLSILPITKGNYLIGPFNTHEKITYCTDIKPRHIDLRDLTPLETIDPQNLYSEAAVLSFAYNSGIISDIMECSRDQVHFTVSGRMGSGKFSFSIANRKFPQTPIPVEVENAQIEIDAGFESPKKFVICEAKNQASEELLIRQLYYPYRLWQEKISKSVVPVFLAFSNEVFHVFIYQFSDSQNYNSITLQEYRKYMFADEEILLQDIIDLWRSIIVVPESTVPFPQADSFPRVLDLLSVLHGEELTRSAVTRKYEFDPRQTNYYVSACEYLGLIERFSIGENGRRYRLTAEARTIMSLPYKKKHLALMKKILEHSVFHEAFRPVANGNGLPDRNEVCRIMQSVVFPKPMSDTTIGRRSSTVLGWLDWVIQISVAD